MFRNREGDRELRGRENERGIYKVGITIGINSGRDVGTRTLQVQTGVGSQLTLCLVVITGECLGIPSACEQT